MTKALWLVRSEMLARRSRDAQDVAEAKGQRLAEAFHPGVYITEEVDARGWQLSCLEHASGVCRWVLDQIMNGHGGVTEAVADGLAKAFGVDAKTWMNMQTMYDEHTNAKRAEL